MAGLLGSGLDAALRLPDRIEGAISSEGMLTEDPVHYFPLVGGISSTVPLVGGKDARCLTMGEVSVSEDSPRIDLGNRGTWRMKIPCKLFAP